MAQRQSALPPRNLPCSPKKRPERNLFRPSKRALYHEEECLLRKQRPALMAQIAGKINSTSRANPTIHLHSVQKLRFLRCARTRRVSRPSQLPGHETRRVDPRLRIIPLKMAIFPRGWRRGRLQRGDSELLWSRSVKQPRLDPAHGSRTAARRKPGIEINFRESVRRTRRPPARPRLSVLFAESLSLREIQSRARPRAPPRPPPTLPPYPRVFSFDSRARACAIASDGQRGRDAHALSIRVFARYVNSLPDVDRRAQGTQLRAARVKPLSHGPVIGRGRGIGKKREMPF
jgi:hypothetical protein